MSLERGARAQRRLESMLGHVCVAAVEDIVLSW
jgi:hypothetical protein